MERVLGWVGVDQYDEGNLVGQKFLDEYNEAYGRRPEWCVPVVNRDVAMTLVRALERRSSAESHEASKKRSSA